MEAKMKKKLLNLLTLLVGIVVVTPVFATDYIVPSTMSHVVSSTFQGIGPGDRILISAGNRGPLTIRGLRGEPGNPIVIVNSGGRVNIDATWTGVSLSNCKHIKLTGNGIEGITYGFLISDGYNLGVRAGDKTDEIEIEYVEITKVKIGISAQTVRDINGDPVGREWTQYNTTIHHCYIHDVEGEGMYIGGSYYKEGTTPLLKGVYIYNNILKNVGFDGIQISSATKNVEVHHNTITDVGMSKEGNPPRGANGQDGIFIGEGTVGSYYNNRIVNSGQDGIVATGLGQYDFYNNIIINTGLGQFGGKGIAMFTGKNFTIRNNTIIKAKKYGICIMGTSGTIFDNIISDSGIAAITATSLPAENIHNNETGSVAKQQFSNAATGDYTLTESSPARDTGSPSGYASFDYGDVPRPQGKDPDKGAFEYYIPSSEQLSPPSNLIVIQ
jgi:parallel beta-helix repeat protein